MTYVDIATVHGGERGRGWNSYRPAWTGYLPNQLLEFRRCFRLPSTTLCISREVCTCIAEAQTHNLIHTRSWLARDHQQAGNDIAHPLSCSRVVMTLSHSWAALAAAVVAGACVADAAIVDAGSVTGVTTAAPVFDDCAILPYGCPPAGCVGANTE